MLTAAACGTVVGGYLGYLWGRGTEDWGVILISAFCAIAGALVGIWLWLISWLRRKPPG